MAQLPGLAQDTPQGQSLPPIGPGGTDLGLGELSQAAEGLAQRQRVQDTRAVAPAVVALNGALNDALAKGAASYDGSPGFVEAQQAQARAAAAAARAALADKGATPGQLTAFDRQAQAQLLQHSAGAYAAQTRAQAAPIAEAFANAQSAKVNGALVDAESAYAPAVQAAKANYTSGDPVQFRDQTLAQFDQAAADAVEKLPTNLQPAAQADLARRRFSLAGDLVDFALQHQQAGVLKAAGDQLTTAIDTIVTAPGQYDDFTRAGGTLDRVLGTLPAGVQADARREYLAKAALARIDGLIDAHQGAQAEAELKANRYAGVLSPEQTQSAFAKVANDGPDAAARGAAAWTAEQRINADLASRAAGGPGVLKPGELDADAAAGILSGERTGEVQAQQAAASRIGAATGPVAAMTSGQLAAAAAEPKPAAEDVIGEKAWQARQAQVAAEQKRRSASGEWAWTKPGKWADGRPTGDVLQGMWQAATQPGPQRGAAASAYAGNMLQVQLQAGIAPAERQIVPQPTAAALAAAVAHAPPEGRLAAMQGLAAQLNALPSELKLTDGSVASPRAMLVGQLVKAGLAPIEATAVYDFGIQHTTASEAALGRVVAAMNDTALKGAALPTEKPIPALVRGDLAPFLASDIDGGALTQGRIDRTILVARELARGGMAPEAAAGQAARDLTGGYRFVHGWRMPAAAAAVNVPLPGVSAFNLINAADGAKAADIGSAHILAGLTANGGAGLIAPSTIAGDVPQRQRIYASQVLQNGRWKTLPDDSGLVLAIPKPDGQWQAVTDKWGRPVKASWSDLQGVAQGRPSPFAAPPAGAIKTSAGAPVRAFSRSEGFAALTDAVQWQETRNDPARISPAGAIGAMQLMPDTGARYAAQLGLPWDPARALHDVPYNRQIGQAALGDLVNRYGTGAGLGLALAAYNAGEGRLTGWHDKAGVFHPGWLHTLGDPRGGALTLQQFVDRIPIKETRDYVGQVLSHAVDRLHGEG